MVERRQYQRYRLISEITGKVKSTMDVQLIDISEGGVLVETKLGLPPASFCELKFSLHGSELGLQTKVRRCRAQLTKTAAGCKVAYRSGLEFVNTDENQMEIVRQLISTCCEAGGGIGDPAAVKQGAVAGGTTVTV